MAIAALSTSDLSTLEEGLKKLGPPGAVAAAAITPTDLQKEFCLIWPKAKPILTMIAKYLPLILGVGGTAGAILNGLIDALEELSKVVCATPAGG